MRALLVRLLAALTGALALAGILLGVGHAQAPVVRVLLSATPKVYDFMVPGTLPAGATLTRASTGWYANASLALASASTDAGRWTYDQSTGALLGLLVEPAVTNSLRNGTAAGAAAGSPGTQPTNWSLTGNGGSFNGLSRTIVAQATEDGLTGLSVRYAGTPSAGGSITFNFDNNTQVAALQGQTWLGGGFARLLAGALINPLNFSVVERNSGGSSLGSSILAVTPTGAAARTQRFDIPARTFANATAAAASINMTYAYTLGVAEDFTLFVADLQLVQAAAASSPIPTSSAAVARAADVLSLAIPDGTWHVKVRRAAYTTLAVVRTSGGTGWTVPTDPSPIQRIEVSP